MGSLFSPKISTPAPPPPPQNIDVQDNISGTRTRYVTGADGKTTAVIENNYTPEQQQIQDNLKKLSEAALAKYEALVNDPLLQTMPEIKSAVDTIYNNQRSSLDKNFKTAATVTEKAAAQFGIEDSSTANQLRGENSKNYAGALNQLEADKVGLTNQYRQQEMTNQLGLYGTASGRQDTLFAQGMQTLNMGNQLALQAANRQDNYQNNLYNNAASLSIAKGNAKAQGLQALGQIGGAALGYGLSGGFGFAGTAANSTPMLAYNGISPLRNGGSIKWN